jgi:hypothetical protein
MLHFTKKRVVVLGAIATLAMGGLAFAFFTSTGTGAGSASTGTDTSYAVTTDAALGAPLTPAGPTQTVGYHVKNNGSGNQKFTNVAIKIANADGSAWDGPGTCSASDFSVGGEAAGVTHNDTTTSTNLLPAASASGSVTIQMVETDQNQDDCKSVTVPLHLAVS